MRRALSTLLAAVVTAVFLCPGPVVAAPPPARAAWWRALALTAINQAAVQDGGGERSSTYADMAGAEGYLYGWSSTGAQHYLTALYGQRLPSGGWGIGEAWDAFNDGSVNPADTVYTVTLAGVGSTLLAAYKSGAVPKADVQKVIALLMAMPLASTARGACVAYSDQAADAAAGCVHNVNAGVAAFLSAANAQGFGATGMQKLITNITIAELVAYHEDTFWWSYIDDGPVGAQDPDHNSYSAESMYGLAYWVGREVTYRLMTTTPAVNAQDPVAHLRLTGLPGGTGSWAVDGGTLWCSLGDTWKAEATAYLGSLSEASRSAQVAVLAARASRVCAA